MDEPSVALASQEIAPRQPGQGDPGGARREAELTEEPNEPSRPYKPVVRVDVRAEQGDHEALRPSLDERRRELGAHGRVRTATVTRLRAHSRPSSSVSSTSQTHVVRPRCRRRAVPWTAPLPTGRRNEDSLDMPRPTMPSAARPWLVPSDASPSAIAAWTPPCTRPSGCVSSSLTRTRPRTSSSVHSTSSRP